MTRFISGLDTLFMYQGDCFGTELKLPQALWHLSHPFPAQTKGSRPQKVDHLISRGPQIRSFCSGLAVHIPLEDGKLPSFPGATQGKSYRNQRFSRVKLIFLFLPYSLVLMGHF